MLIVLQGNKRSAVLLADLRAWALRAREQSRLARRQLLAVERACMTKPRDRKAVLNSGNAMPEYPGKFQTGCNTHPIDYLIRLLSPDRLTPEIEALFDNRTSAGTVRQWRYGRQAMPAWAFKILQAKIRAHLETYESAMAETARRHTLSEGPRTNPSVRARLVRLAEQKEKAGV